jgi:hypothetical protein
LEDPRGVGQGQKRKAPNPVEQVVAIDSQIKADKEKVKDLERQLQEYKERVKKRKQRGRTA